MKVTTILVAAALGTAIGIGAVEMSHGPSGADMTPAQAPSVTEEDSPQPAPTPPTALAEEAEEPAVPPTPVAAPAPAPPPAREGGYQDDFAALNARRPGVVTLPSGVQYEVLEAGSGRKPLPQDSVRVNYEASLPDGRVFDTTADDAESEVLPISSIAVPGLREALLLMPEGSRWRVVVPPSQGFRHAGNNMLRRRVLIYDIRLLSIEPSN